MALISEAAPAKINLTLDVLGKRADGYHELRSLVAFADAADRLTLDTSQLAGVTVSGSFAGSIAGANLIETTLRLIAEAAPELQLGAVHLEKNLPVAAGIGGGSADAAAVIRAVRTANPQACTDVDWNALALRIGADVPVCLASRLSWMSGLGEIVAPISLKTSIALPAIIVNPLVSVPADKTAQVFRALRAAPLSVPFVAAALPEVRSADELLAVVRSSHNSLEQPCRQIVPAVDTVLRALEGLPSATIARMSGGGPTCFALFATSDAANAAATSLSAVHPEWWVRATTLS
jgi:4-diphosphocytidyl-2-C-methyl-D-erythritol kinase